MRILHLISTLDRKAGGPATSIRAIASNYQVLGHEGEVVTLDDPAAPYLKDLGFPVHALGPASLPFGYTPKLIPWLKAERHRFDGVVVSWPLAISRDRRTTGPSRAHAVHGISTWHVGSLF